jgi:hypothetical protein
MALNELVNEDKPLVKGEVGGSRLGDWEEDAWAGWYGGGSISPGRGPLLDDA